MFTDINNNGNNTHTNNNGNGLPNNNNNNNSSSTNTILLKEPSINGLQPPESNNNNNTNINTNNISILNSSTTSTTTASTTQPPPPLEKQETSLEDNLPWASRMWEICTQFPYMGATAFGGPAMAVTLLEAHFVKKKKWLDQSLFKELFGLVSSFPGPTQGLMACALGAIRGGAFGGAVALMLYSLPGFLIMFTFGMLSQAYFDPYAPPPDWMAGLGPAAISLLFLACLKLGKSHCGVDKIRLSLALISAVATLLVTGDSRVNKSFLPLMFPVLLICGGLTTFFDSRRNPERLAVYFKPTQTSTEEFNKKLRKKISITRAQGSLLILTWLTILVVFITLRALGMLNAMGKLFESFFRVGTMIFGGGYVVLPMLLLENLVPVPQFFQGFALVQAIPGPLFNFSAFLGACAQGAGGSFVAAVGLFSPGALLLLGFLPFWARLRTSKEYKAIIAGLASTAVGFVVAACIQLWELAIKNSAGGVVFIFTGSCVGLFNLPVPGSLLAGAILGVILSPIAANLGQVPFCAPPVGSGNSTVVG
jgi:chromate transporter